MRYTSLKCPNCGANLTHIDNSLESFFCMYCGSQIVDEGNHHYTVDINYNYRKIDEARLKEADVKRDINMKRMEMEDREKRSSAWVSILEVALPIALLLVGFVLLMGWGGSSESSRTEQEEALGKITVGTRSDDFEGQKYVAVEATLKASGFTDIELIDLDDAGFFKNKKDTVATVSIGGEQHFFSSDYFYPTDKVIISYH